VNENASGTEVTATPSAGYHFVSWSDGVMTAARTDTNVAANHTVSAAFAANRPAAPYSVTWSPVAGGTLIQWAGSPGATGYQVWLGTPPIEPEALTLSNSGRLLGTTGPSTCYLFVPEYLGPGSTIYVVALGTSMNSLPGAGVYTASVTPVQMGTVRFNGNSPKLTPATKRALRSYASLMATQGFTSLKVSGYTAARDHGSKAFRRRLSLKRAKNVKAYLATQFRTLHASVSITTAGYGGTNPVATNRTAWGMSRNRRAELLLK
jgi:outer membrane protein OmpA-like peptidoglycan-associated protein